MSDEPSFVTEQKGEDNAREQLVDVLKSTYVKKKGSVLGSKPKKSMACRTTADFRAPAPRRSFKPDFDWIQKYSAGHKGEWVALKDGKLLDSDRSRHALWLRLKDTGLLKGAVFFKIEE
jgi:hypothetical protein